MEKNEIHIESPFFMCFIHGHFLDPFYSHDAYLDVLVALIYIPDNWKKNSSTAHKVHEDEDLLPYSVLWLTFLTFLNDDIRNVV